MNTLERFTQRKEENAAKTKAENEAWRKLQESFRDTERALYSEFRGLILPFKGYKLGKLIVHITCSNSQLSIKLTIGKFFRRFVAQTVPHFCNCSQCCDGCIAHDTTYSQEIVCYKPNGDGESTDYFTWYGNTPDARQEKFVQSIEELFEKAKSFNAEGSR